MFDRFTPAAAPRRARSQTASFPGPVRGWIRNESLARAGQGGAERLDNWFPTPEGARMRAGSTKHATIDSDVVALMVYDSGSTQKLFAANGSAIYDVTSPADPDVAVTADVSGLGSGDWAYVQFANSAGTFLIAVDGVDDQWLYDGTDWWDIGTSDIKILPYDNEVTGFTAGETVTGATSGDTGDIFKVEDNGTDGNLFIKNATGDFSNNETINGSGGGEALVNTNDPLAVKYSGITGVATASLSHVWAFKKRLFFVEKDTLSAWYLGSLAIGGTATEFPLKGLFKKGGSLLFGATWSQDAGDGLDDYCLFVTDKGEVAVYQGTDPASWSLVGVYNIGEPLDKNAHFRAGGDLGVLTDDGIIPMSSAVNKAGAALSGDAITYPIEEKWRDIIRDRKDSGTFSVVLWHNRTALYVGVPSPQGFDDVVLAANSRTGAWARYTGWQTTAFAVHDDKLYFGTSAGTVVQGEVGGDDQDANYSAVWVPRFDMLGSAVEKAALHARILARTEEDISVQLFAVADYEITVPTPLAADAETSSSVWGTGAWGTSTWAAERTVTALSAWQAVAANGVALAPGLQVTTGRTVAPSIEVITMHLQYEAGQVMA